MSGNPSAPSSRLTIRDIARLAGVSAATVSRVLSGKRKVAPETRARVLEVIRAHGFQPSAVARGLATGQLETIGLIVADIRNPFDAELARGVEDACFEAGLTVVIASSDGDPERERRHLEAMRAHRFAGVVLTSATESSRLDAWPGWPIVLVNRYLLHLPWDSVRVDNLQGGYLATRHLLELGHRRIAHLAGPPSSSASRDRLEGYRRALREWYPQATERVEVGDLKFETGYALAPRLIGQGEVTAVFAANDLMAIGVLEWALEHGVNVPQELSIVGFDDTLLARVRRVSLTTVRQPQYAMGRAGAEMLLRRIRGEAGPPRQLVFSPELVVRGSCAPPPEAVHTEGKGVGTCDVAPR